MNNNPNSALQEAFMHLIAASHILNAAGFPNAEETNPVMSNNNAADLQKTEETSSTKETAREDCIILSMNDFNLLIEDMIELADMVDCLLETSNTQKQFLDFLKDLTNELNASLTSEKLKTVQKRTDSILEKWANASIIPVTP